MKNILLTTLLAGFSLLVLAASDPVFRFTDASERVYLGEFVQVLTDSTGSLTWDDVQTREDFNDVSSQIIPLGVSEYNHWLRITVENATSQGELFLEVDFAVLDEVDVYIRTPDSLIVTMTGERRGQSSKAVAYSGFAFPFHLEKGQQAEIYLRVKSSEQINLPVSIGASDEFWNAVTRNSLFFGIYAGVFLVMFFYNLFIFTTTKDRAYAIYILYLFCVGMVQASLEGYGSAYLWSYSTGFASLSLYIFNALTAFTSIAFFRAFVKLPELLPVWDKILLGVGSLYVFELIFAFMGMTNLAYNLMNMAATLLALLLFVVSILAIRRGSRQAQFFLTGWSFFLASIIVFVLKDVGVLPYNLFTSNVLQFGSGLEVVLLSFGLADRINILKREKELSQQATVEALREKERLVRSQNEMLELKVKERTTELVKANGDLSDALNELKSAQTQLVEQEKMASLGQLTAGIAHEINNPINFVTANVKPLQRDIHDILEVLDAYEGVSDAGEFTEKKPGIESLKEELELPYIRSEIESLLTGIDDGARRTAEIVRGLKVFSRTDEQDLKRVDLVEGIESTLTLLNNSMKGKMELVKDYEAIPKVECYAGKLNQVFMNILSNAVYAVDTQFGAKDGGKITIALKDVGEHVEIVFSDNGTGMPEDVRTRIFEPFYTTKPVGDGTGLGLSITKSIIDKHNGSVSVTSKEGEGTTFRIMLPKIQES